MVDFKAYLGDSNVTLYPESSDPDYANSALKAIDGKFSLDMKDCAQTENTTEKKTFTVTMSRAYPIEAVRLYLSNVPDTSIFTGLVVKTGKNSQNWHNCGRSYAAATMSRFPLFECGFHNDHIVLVELKNGYSSLSLCEIEVYYGKYALHFLLTTNTNSSSKFQVFTHTKISQLLSTATQTNTHARTRTVANIHTRAYARTHTHTNKSVYIYCSLPVY